MIVLVGALLLLMMPQVGRMLDAAKCVLALATVTTVSIATSLCFMFRCIGYSCHPTSSCSSDQTLFLQEVRSRCVYQLLRVSHIQCF
jgi:hypothetical protein